VGPPLAERRLAQLIHFLRLWILDIVSEFLAILTAHQQITQHGPGAGIIAPEVLLEGIVRVLPPAHILPAKVAAHIVVGILVGIVVESCEGQVFGDGPCVWPAQAGLVVDFDGFGEAVRAELHNVHRGRWFSGPGHHSETGRCGRDGHAEGAVSGGGGCWTESGGAGCCC